MSLGKTVLFISVIILALIITSFIDSSSGYLLLEPNAQNIKISWATVDTPGNIEIYKEGEKIVTIRGDSSRKKGGMILGNLSPGTEYTFSLWTESGRLLDEKTVKTTER